MKINFFEELNKYNGRDGLNKKKIFGPDLNFFQNDTLLEPKESPLYIGKTTKTWHSALLFVLVFVFLFILFSKAVNLQIIQNKLYKSLSDENRIRKFTIQPERGVIYDRNKNILVRNKPAFSLEMNTNICSLGRTNPVFCKKVVEKLLAYASIDLERVYGEIDSGKMTVILATGLTKENILPIEANLISFPSVSISTLPQRDYLFNDAFSHLIGYVGFGDTLLPLITGKTGVEESYDQYLSGVPGSRIVQIDSVGKSFEQRSQKNAISGRDVVLFVDLDLQKKAYELLKEVVDNKKANAGVVVAQDPQTGGILALVSYPGFDPNKLSGGISSLELAKLSSDPQAPFFNRAVSAAYPPGSVFKLIVASAGLSEKVVTQYTQIFDPGYIKVGSYTFKNWKTDGHGVVNIKRALQVSNDTYFYTVGGGYGDIKGLGIEKLSLWAKKFGLGSKTKIDIGGEASGFMPDGKEKTWYLGDTYITSIGQGDVLATPLQINNVTAYFSNGGYLYVPRVVKSIDGMGETKKSTITQNIVDEKTYKLVRDGMNLAVVSGGTGYPLFDFSQKHNGIELAGKTGTSEYIDKDGKVKTHAWFTVFGPYDSANFDGSIDSTGDGSIALTVFLEGGGSGADDAAPIARKLLDLWFLRDQISQTR